VWALRQIAFQLERSGAPTYRVRAFRRAAEVVASLSPGELADLVRAGTLRQLAGIGEVTAQVIAQAAVGQEPDEVDILEDGSLDQTEELLGQLDVVVASVHSKLRMPSTPMTQRMVAAIRNPHTDVLGHCTGRIVTGRGRPQAEFDAEAVFTACRESGVAVEVNCRPERQDPPDDLLQLAVELGCVFAIDTDAHAPGQLDWLDAGCIRAELFGIGPDRVINTRSAPLMTSRGV